MNVNLLALQNVDQVGADLRSVPAAPSSSGAGVASALNFLGDFGTTAFQANAKFTATQAAKSGDIAVGKLTTKLANIQQAGMTDPRINTQQAQRKAFTEWAASNTEFAQEGMNAFNSATGIKVAELSAEQQVEQKLQETAWTRGFGSVDATPEENKKQLTLYKNIQRESDIMAYEASKETADTNQKKKQLQGSTAKLATWKTESLNETLKGDLQAIKNGASREQFVSKWAKLKVDWSNEIAQYGEFANDPTIKAQLTGVTEMFTFADGMVDGSKELEVLETSIKAAVAKQEAILVLPDPEGARNVAVSKAFGHTPAAQIPMSNYIARVLSKPAGEAADARSIKGAEARAVVETLSNMGNSEDLETKKQAATQVTQIAKHLDRNGEDYTDDEILETCSVIAAPSVFNGMSKEDKSLVQNACETYAVDVAGKAIRDIETNGSVNVAVTTPGLLYGNNFSHFKTLQVNEYATLTADKNGFSYTIKDAYKNDRQVRRQLQTLNKNLSKVNPVLSILSSASGLPQEEVAANVWGIGPIAEQRAKVASQQNKSMTEGLFFDRQQGLSTLTDKMTQAIGGEQTTQAQPEQGTAQAELDKIISREGGFQNNPSDTGNIVDGKVIGTNYGITARSLATFNGVDANTITEEDIRNITPEVAKTIYEKNYLTGPKIDQLPANVQDMIFDTGVTSGPTTSIKILQKLAGVTADGRIGPKTIEAAAKVDREELRAAIRAHYEELSKKGKNAEFVKGWVNRINSI